MTTLTRERLEQIANFHSQMALPPSHAEIEELARIALAVMQQEPVDFEAWWNGPRWPEPLVERALKDTAREAWNAAPLVPVVPDEMTKRKACREYSGRIEVIEGYRDGWNACRAAMLQGKAEPVSNRDELNSPVVTDGYCVMPMKLTEDNGAKGALSGEFSETKFINCPECFGDDECETCDGSGRIKITVPVTWTTIKAIWAKGVEHFTAAPQQ